MNLKELKKYFVSSIYELYPSEEVQSFFNLLSEKHLGLSRIEIALNSDKSISEAKTLLFNEAIQRLKNFEPVQYIIGETEFYGLPFKVDKDVLIPRPETEELVSWVNSEFRTQNPEFKILDIGTGSGCIAISLASKLPNAKISALDISKGAIEIAKENVKLNEVEVDLKEADILNSSTWNLIFEDLEFSCIVSNPPYVRELEKELMEPNVVKHEPATALFVKDDDPLLFYRKIAEFSQLYLKKGGFLFFEINEYLSENLVVVLVKMNFKNIEVKKDIFGKDRMVKCNK